MLDPMNIGIYDKEGRLIDFSDDEWDEYTEEDLKKMEEKRLAREERQKRKQAENKLGKRTSPPLTL